MSDMSLNSGYYVVIKHVAELVDEALLQLKTHDVQPETLRKLSEILAAAAEKETRDMSAGLLRVVLEEHPGHRIVHVQADDARGHQHAYEHHADVLKLEGPLDEDRSSLELVRRVHR